MTFDEYNKLIAFTVAQNNGHCDPLWAWLECAGELGEMLELLMKYAGSSDNVQSDFDVDLYMALGGFHQSAQDLEKRKKAFRREQTPPFSALCVNPPQITPTPELLKELGGMLWGLNQLCNQCGTTMEEVADVNYRELKARFEGNPEWLLTKGAEGCLF
jgi:hypothetical protein